jgi:hypothetical protein
VQQAEERRENEQYFFFSYKGGWFKRLHCYGKIIESEQKMKKKAPGTNELELIVIIQRQLQNDRN